MWSSVNCTVELTPGSRFVDFRLRLEAEMAAKFSPLTAYSKRNGYVLLRADENGDITIGSEQGGRFAAGVTEHTMDPVQERAVRPGGAEGVTRLC